MSTAHTTLATLTTGAKLEELNPVITQRRLKNWVNTNLDRFAERCLVKVGARVFYDPVAVEEWLQEHRGKTAGTRELR